jgi:hypothetical protein
MRWAICRTPPPKIRLPQTKETTCESQSSGGLGLSLPCWS